MTLHAPRIAVPGLREADATSLLVMTQDLWSRSVVHLVGETLAALFALSELGDELPRHLHRDLDAFARQKERELRDLPEGAPLREQLEEIAEVAPGLVPQRLRLAVLAQRTERQLDAACAGIVNAMEQVWAEHPPERLQLGRTRAAPVQRPAVPARLRMPDDDAPERPGATAAAARVPRTPRPTPAARVDQARCEWIRKQVLARLDGRREQGLKESVLLAATSHESPYGDLQNAEILAELRELKRLGLVKNTAGRWVRVRRLGW